ncbi:MAG: hypothetical protein IJ093_01655 [Bacilli bacterium]|nr:hypothetical protein [Bacilli bacterium]
MKENFYEIKKKIMLAKTNSEKIELIKSYVSNRFDVNLYEAPEKGENLDKILLWTAKDYQTFWGGLGKLLKWAGSSSERDDLLKQWRNWDIVVAKPSSPYEKKAFQFLEELQQMSDDEKIVKIGFFFDENFKEGLDNLADEISKAKLSHNDSYEKELNDLTKNLKIEEDWFKEQAISTIKDPDKRLKMANIDFHNKEMREKTLEMAIDYLEQTKGMTEGSKLEEEVLSDFKKQAADLENLSTEELISLKALIQEELVRRQNFEMNRQQGVQR